MSIKIKNLNPDEVGLVQQLEDGRIIQIGLSVEQSAQLQEFLKIISQGQPLVQMTNHEFIFKPEDKSKGMFIKEFTEMDMHEAWVDGCSCGEQRAGNFNIDDYKKK